MSSFATKRAPGTNLVPRVSHLKPPWKRGRYRKVDAETCLERRLDYVSFQKWSSEQDNKRLQAVNIVDATRGLVW